MNLHTLGSNVFCVDHSDLYFNIQKDGLGGYGRTEKGFAYLWAGCRATWGCKDGRYCFECKVCILI